MQTSVVSPTKSRNRPKYVPALDGVRFLAVLLVILHHITGGSHASLLMRVLSLQEGNGIGPSLFFVLSGTLLTTVILDSKNDENRYRNFMMRRVLRIFPLYFGYLALAVFATWGATHALPRHFWVYGLFLQNTFVRIAGSTGSVIPLYHFWTLAVQDQFYLIWPLLIWRCRDVRQMRHLCYGLMAMSFLWRVLFTMPPFTPASFVLTLPSRSGAMCLGALIALEAYERTKLTTALRRGFMPLMAVCVVWMWFGLGITTKYGLTFGLQLMGLTCGALIMTCLDPKSVPSRVLGAKWFAEGGKQLAFAMYIFHPMLLDMCSHLPIHSKLLRFVVFMTTTLALSAVTYRLIERPILHLPVGRKATRKPAPKLEQANVEPAMPGLEAEAVPS